MLIPIPPTFLVAGDGFLMEEKSMITTLTPKQQCFVEEYLVDLNATQAAIRAGYSKKTAKTIAAQNLAKLPIRRALSD